MRSYELILIPNSQRCIVTGAGCERGIAARSSRLKIVVNYLFLFNIYWTNAGSSRTPCAWKVRTLLVISFFDTINFDPLYRNDNDAQRHEISRLHCTHRF